jgi:hypothetical protein
MKSKLPQELRDESWTFLGGIEQVNSTLNPASIIKNITETKGKKQLL